ncbi:MAG: hypothetical protein P0120_04640 [Nitrospira sp.]|nr:hypothetical protein [Nitrospira sp.]
MKRWLSIAFGILWAIGVIAGSVAIADKELPEGPAGGPGAKPSGGKQPEAVGGRIGGLESRVMGATPEERTRLAEERKRISAAAAATGNDPTAIVGYYQAGYGHTEFTNGLRLDTATAVVRVPLTPNWLFQVTLPYAWADLDRAPGFPTDGISDTVVRTGWRLYASQNVALFIGGDASFPTASERPLGTGKYTLGPGGGVAAPLPRLRSLFFTQVEDFISVGGDPSRADIHFLRVQPGLNTIWSERWWSLAVMTWNIDWTQRLESTVNLQGTVGYRFDNHWNIFAGGGLGIVNRDSSLGQDWTVQAGVRWVFRTPLIPETIWGGPLGPSAQRRSEREVK